MLSQPASIVRTLAVGSLSALLLAACAGSPRTDAPPRVADSSVQPDPQSQPPRSATTIGERAAVVAVRQLGVPYRYGGNGNSDGGFDCSGLVHYAYKHAGLDIPRTTRTLWQAARPVGKSDLVVGDLLFFSIEGKMSHVGMYIGKRRFVHAPSSGREVTIAELDSDFYQSAFLRGGRLY